MQRRVLNLALLSVLITAGWTVAAENDHVVHYEVNLDDLPEAQVYAQTGARTADGMCTFTD